MPDPIPILEFSESIFLSHRIKIKKKDLIPLFPSLESSKSKYPEALRISIYNIPREIKAIDIKTYAVIYNR